MRVALWSLVLISAMVQAEENTDRSIYEGGLEQRVDALASVAPGLGTLMVEMGYRFSRVYWAAQGGNWGLAQYQLKELREAQEVAEITRPKRAEMLRAYEKNHLVVLEQAIAEKDLSQFNRRFSGAVRGCNACHAALGYGFIEYRVPPKPEQSLLDFSLKTEPRSQEGAEPK